jgi:hypothetical protein
MVGLLLGCVRPTEKDGTASLVERVPGRLDMELDNSKSVNEQYDVVEDYKGVA